MNNPLIPLAVLTLALTACQSTGTVSPVYGPTNPTPLQAEHASTQYYCSMIEMKPGMEEKYRRFHSHVWPAVRAAIRKANIRDYHIYIVELDGKRYLVSTFEHVGNDPTDDLAGMGKDPTTRDKWWPITDACQIKLPGTPSGQQWKPLEQVMHIN